MPNEAPTAETADVDFAALLRTEQAGLQAQLTELGFADQGSGLNYDSNFADSSQVTAERGEAERLAGGVRGGPEEGGGAPSGGRAQTMQSHPDTGWGREPTALKGRAPGQSSPPVSRRCRQPVSAS